MSGRRRALAVGNGTRQTGLRKFVGTAVSTKLANNWWNGSAQQAEGESHNRAKRYCLPIQSKQDDLFRLSTGQWLCEACRTLNEGTDSERCRACATMKPDTGAAFAAAADDAGRGTEAATSAPAPTASIGTTGFIFGVAQPPAADAGRVPASNGRPLAAAAGGFAFAPVPAAATDAVAPVPTAVPTAAIAATGAPANGFAPTSAATAPAAGGFSFPNVGTDTAPPPAAVPGLPLGGQNPMVAQPPQQQLTVAPAAEGTMSTVMRDCLESKAKIHRNKHGNLDMKYLAYELAMETAGEDPLEYEEWNHHIDNSPAVDPEKVHERLKDGRDAHAAFYGWIEGEAVGTPRDDTEARAAYNNYLRVWPTTEGVKFIERRQRRQQRRQQ